MTQSDRHDSKSGDLISENTRYYKMLGFKFAFFLFLFFYVGGRGLNL